MISTTMHKGINLVDGLRGISENAKGIASNDTPMMVTICRFRQLEYSDS